MQITDTGSVFFISFSPAHEYSAQEGEELTEMDPPKLNSEKIRKYQET